LRKEGRKGGRGRMVGERDMRKKEKKRKGKERMDKEVRKDMKK
jgi:hypothetical protein